VRDSPDAPPSLTVAALIVWDAAGRVLTVRKRDTDMFMLPGGKLEDGEAPDAAAVREFAEELGVALAVGDLVALGEHHTDAANEPGHALLAHVFAYPGLLADASPAVEARPAAEIAEARWLDPGRPDDLQAPLTLALLPVLRAGRAAL
jgi:8-oxo-dGTP diphosphatase